ncbi:hydantoinase B/oxoprolinase family protein, partial [[Kitasatospora] papulosa]|uniref:hydantoinase B/oxoprolinase family protein n=2 Tax=[Kitasatospora] papulosa TaxID=1464011 RepID=UPI0036BBE5EB
GGQHACAVADALGVGTVLVPPLAGVLSAYGIGLADATAMREQSVEAALDEDTGRRVRAVRDDLAERTRAELRADGIPDSAVTTRARIRLRYAGTDASLPVAHGAVATMAREFTEAHRARYGFTMDKPLVAEAVSVEATGTAGPHTAPRTGVRTGEGPPRPLGTVRMFTGDGWRDAALHRRDTLRAEDVVRGPAVIAEDDATTVVDLGWQATAGTAGHLVLSRTEPRPGRTAVGTRVDPVMLEVFNNLFMSIAEQMGVRLENTAHSVNIKERLDFSCALFDADGGLVANAPHIPVHLGSMGESIEEVLRRNAGTLRPGDVYAVNDPYHGGTHLPDVTVVSPVFDEPAHGERARLRFLVASRGHHAEIGGITPGSMPAFSRTVDEEGVLFDNWLLVRDGTLREAETRRLLTGAAHPSRDPDTNLADLRAQIAANEKGITELRRMTRQFGQDVVEAYMGHVQDNAEESVRRIVAGLRDGSCRYETDNGAVIAVRVDVDREARRAVIDFEGTSPQQSGNFNAPRSVVTAAVLYVFRTLVEEDIPLNSGCLKPLDIRVPEGSMLAPVHPAATVAGNVETSQAVTGALYAALGVQAEGSGTMNNLTFGNDRVQYYETVASGSGAGEGFDGADAVQTHMTNSRLTDPEILEWRYPVLLESFGVREDGGGTGRRHGGRGAERRIRFLEPVTVALLSGHRRVPPYGMAGGGPGALGEQYVERADGRTVTPLEGCDTAALDTGDVLVLRTPGGGGYGRP